MEIKIKLELGTRVIIKFPEGMPVAMSRKEFCQLHDDLTKFYNNNYKILNKDED